MDAEDPPRCDRKRMAEAEEVPRKKHDSGPSSELNSDEETYIYFELLQHGFTETQALNGLCSLRGSGSEISFEKVMIHIISQVEVRIV